MATAFRTRREPRVQGRATPRRPAERRAFAHLPRRVSGLPGPGASERAAVNVARGPACGRGWPPPQASATERECRQSALTLDTAPGVQCEYRPHACLRHPSRGRWEAEGSGHAPAVQQSVRRRGRPCATQRPPAARGYEALEVWLM